MPKDMNIDSDGLRDGANMLVDPGKVLVKTSTTTETDANHIKTPTGKPPWGDGEIGDAFYKTYAKPSVNLITGAKDLGNALLKMSDNLKVAANQYHNTETGNTK